MSASTCIVLYWISLDWQVRAYPQEHQHSSNRLCITVYLGFDYEFDSLQSKEDEFGAAFYRLMPGGSVPINSSYWIIRPILMAFVPMILKLVRALVFWRTYYNNSMMQPSPFAGVKRLRAAKKVIDRIGNQLVAERKSALLQEQSSGVKEKSDTTGRDLLSLLVRANFQDTDCMSDSVVRSRKGSPRALCSSYITRVSSRDRYLPHRWSRDDERRHVLDPFWPFQKSRGTEKAPGRAFSSPHG